MSTARRTALVTGAAGQDGSYLCERLVHEGVDVHAAVTDLDRALRSPHLVGCTVRRLDLRDPAAVARAVSEVEPDEVYNLAGMSSVARSWREPLLTAQVNALPVAALLQAAHALQELRGRVVRVVQASSAEMFGNAATSPQDEATPIVPNNPYGAAKAYGHQVVGVYRSLGVHAVSCILYNHESPRRPDTYVARKIARAAARIADGRQQTLVLGTLESRRDWGWAPDYVDGMVRAGRHERAVDVVLATGNTHSIAEFAEAAFEAAGVADWRSRVELDPGFRRPVDTTEQCGDPSLARSELAWENTVPFPELVRRMVAADRLPD